MTIRTKQITGRVRRVAVGDAIAIQAIYSHYVTETAVSFELVPPTTVDITDRIAKITATYPWLVCEDAGEVVGYAYASQHRVREAYRWSVDVTVYVRPDKTRQGIGRELYSALLSEVDRRGYANAFAGITLPNAASVALHESVGFEPIGVYRKVGFKMGRWHDAGWWQRGFEHPEAPKEPLQF